jgi:hypothetical protein
MQEIIRLCPELQKLYVNPLFTCLDEFLVCEGRELAESIYLLFFVMSMMNNKIVFDKEQIMIITKECFRFIYQNRNITIFIDTNSQFHVRSQRCRLASGKEYMIVNQMPPVQTNLSFYTDKQHVKMLVSPTHGYEIITDCG